MECPVCGSHGQTTQLGFSLPTVRKSTPILPGLQLEEREGDESWRGLEVLFGPIIYLKDIFPVFHQQFIHNAENLCSP